ILGNAQDVFRGVDASPLGPLRGRDVRQDGTSGVDGFGGFNTSAVVVEVPISMILPASATSTMVKNHNDKPKPPVSRGYLGNATTVGVWGTTSRTRHERFSTRHDPRAFGPFIQFQRLGHQVFKTIFIPSEAKDPFNRSEPADDAVNVSKYIPDALTSTDTNGNTIQGRADLLTALGVTALPNGVPLLLPGSFA